MCWFVSACGRGCGMEGGFLVLVASGGVGCIQFYEGVKDFVGKDGMFIVKVVAAAACSVCMWNLSMVLRRGSFP